MIYPPVVLRSLLITAIGLVTHFSANCQSTSIRPWESFQAVKYEKASVQAEKLLDKDPTNAMALCVVGWTSYLVQDDIDNGISFGIEARDAWRNRATTEQKAAWGEGGFGILDIEALLQQAGMTLATRVTGTPSTADNRAFLHQYPNLSQDVVQKVHDDLERRELDEALRTGSREALDAFLREFPLSKMAAEAIVAIEQFDFSEAEHSGTETAWLQFIRNHPQSILVSQAKMALDELHFDKAVKSLNPNLLEAYLQQHPEGKHVNEVVNMRDSLELDFALQLNTANSLRHFVKTRPNSPFLDQALESLSDVLWEHLQNVAHPDSMVAFVLEFPRTEEAEAAGVWLDSMSNIWGQSTWLDQILIHDIDLAETDVLRSLFDLKCHRGNHEFYFSFLEEYSGALSTRRVLREQIEEAYEMALDPPSTYLILNDEDVAQDFTGCLYSRSLAAFELLRDDWMFEERGVIASRLEDLVEQGMSNRWAQHFINQSHKAVVAESVVLSSNVNSSTDSELVPVISADNRELYFCRHPGLGSEYDTENIYVSIRQQDSWGLAKPVSELNSPYSNDAPLNISIDGTELIGFVSGKISKSTRSNQGWEPFVPMDELNISNWNADAQLVSTKEAYLFAAENGSDDNQDLYVAEIGRNGGVTEVFPLGSAINTSGSERTPFLHPDMSTLYFSSNRHGGLGGLDVFMSKRLADTCWTCWSQPVGLGWAVNSEEDEWGFKIATDGELAYLSKDGDIHELQLADEVRPELVATVEGTLKDRYDQAADAQIVWEDLESGSVIGKANTDPVTGRYFIVLPTGKVYGYYVNSEGYFGTSSSLDLRNQSEFELVQEDIELVYIEDALDTEQDVVIKINNVFFEFGSATLTPLSNAELRRVTELILEHQRRVLLVGHTDHVGSEASNYELSVQRAESVRNALVELGVPLQWLDIRGDGESKPVASNDTDQGRQKNRRVELKFLEE